MKLKTYKTQTCFILHFRIEIETRYPIKGDGGFLRGEANELIKKTEINLATGHIALKQPPIEVVGVYNISLWGAGVVGKDGVGRDDVSLAFIPIIKIKNNP